jgi:hypothetical protein
MTERGPRARGGLVKQIEAQYRTHREGADAGRDQELARRFVQAKESGRGPEWIAQRMGWTQGRVAPRPLFGRFLRFITARTNSFSPPKPLTEGRFRANWSKAGKRKKKSEEERFARVLELLRASGEGKRAVGGRARRP